MTITPKSAITLPFKPSFAFGNGVLFPCIAYDWKTGQGVVLDEKLQTIGEFVAGFPVKRACVHPESGRLVIIKEKEILRVYDFGGKPVREFAGSYACAAFSAGGVLWIFERIGHEQLKWRLLDGDYNPIAETELTDPLYDSAVILTALPDKNEMAMTLAAGQDGSDVFLLSHKDGKLTSTQIFPGRMDCFALPILSRDGRQLLALEFYDRLLYRFSYPEFEELGRFAYDCDEYESNVGDTLFFAGAHTAVISYDNNRYFLLDVDNMTVREEITVTGHGLRPVKHFYPRLADDDSLMTDIFHMKPVGDKVLAVIDFDENHPVLVFDRKDFD